jgi:hypothetical protein
MENEREMRKQRDKELKLVKCLDKWFGMGCIFERSDLLTSSGHGVFYAVLVD